MQRFAGLVDNVHWVRVSHQGVVLASSAGMSAFAWDRPPPNPEATAGRMQQLRRQLLGRMCRSHPHLRDSIDTFSAGDFAC
jgi:hypothetical protein